MELMSSYGFQVEVQQGLMKYEKKEQVLNQRVNIAVVSLEVQVAGDVQKGKIIMQEQKL